MKEIRIEDINVEELDKPVDLELPRNELTPLSEETKEVLSEEGYTDEVVESINSEEEAAIYRDAGLECQHMEGGNNTILHDTTKESEIDRGAFAKEREAHWKARAEEIKQRQEEAA